MEWRSAHNTIKRIQAHVAKLNSGTHTYLSNNGIELILEEKKKLQNRMLEIEQIFKRRKWAL